MLNTLALCCLLLSTAALVPAALSNSKLSVQTGPKIGSATNLFVQKASPRLIKVLDEFSSAKDISSAVVGITIIGRASLTSQPQNGSATAAAQAWWTAQQNTINTYGAVQFWEGYHEPDVSTDAACQWIGEFELARQKLLANISKHAVVFSFASGQPRLTTGCINALIPALKYALSNGNWLGLNEYAAPYMAAQFDNTTNTGLWTGRYRTLYSKWLKPQGLGDLPLVITETGINGAMTGSTGGYKDFADAHGFANQLAWYDTILRADTYVQGATVFLMDGPSGPSYDSFSVGSDVASALITYMNTVNATDGPTMQKEELSWWGSLRRLF